MSASEAGAGDALCPFFRGAMIKSFSWGSKVMCEGPVAASTLTMRFEGVYGYKQYRAKRCDGQFRSCPVYIGLSAKYGGETP